MCTSAAKSPINRMSFRMIVSKYAFGFGKGNTGWSITSFDARIDIQSDGRVLVNETLDVDFGSLDKHGIFRDIPVRYAWPQDPRKIRVYELQVLSVTDAQGRAWRQG